MKYQRIKIETDGVVTKAKMIYEGHVVSEGIARCHSDDEFDYETGVTLALDRMFSNQNRVEVGDMVKIVYNGDTYTTYSDFFEKHCPQFSSKYCYNKTIEEDAHCIVKFIYKHPKYHKNLYVVEIVGEHGYYLIGEDSFVLEGDI